MKQVFLQKLMAIAMLLGCYGAFAQTSENFNSRAEADLTQVKGYLQNHCWQFNDFDINRVGWVPGIEGDGAMVSRPGFKFIRKYWYLYAGFGYEWWLPVNFQNTSLTQRLLVAVGSKFTSLMRRTIFSSYWTVLR